jgi:hypothetical protein
MGCLDIFLVLAIEQNPPKMDTFWCYPLYRVWVLLTMGSTRMCLGINQSFLFEEKKEMNHDTGRQGKRKSRL